MSNGNGKTMPRMRKAVIPAAGLGTRIARAVPKEMLPIVDRPAVSYLVEEAAKSGIEDILIITGRGKGAMEDYFDYSPEYEVHFAAKGKDGAVAEMRKTGDAYRRKHAGSDMRSAVRVHLSATSRLRCFTAMISFSPKSLSWHR